MVDCQVGQSGIEKITLDNAPHPISGGDCSDQGHRAKSSLLEKRDVIVVDCDEQRQGSDEHNAAHSHRSMRF